MPVVHTPLLDCSQAHTGLTLSTLMLCTAMRPSAKPTAMTSTAGLAISTVIAQPSNTVLTYFCLHDRMFQIASLPHSPETTT